MQPLAVLTSHCSQDSALESMSLLQYGQKQIYLFGVESETETANIKDMIRDLRPDHILMAICQERADKLHEIMAKDKSGYFPPLNCQSYIRPDPEAKERHQWKSAIYAKDIISKCGLIYGNAYFETLVEGAQIESRFIFGDRRIQTVVDSIEEWMNALEDAQSSKEARKSKLHAAAEKNVGVTPKGRAKASKSFYTRARGSLDREMAQLDRETVIDLDNAGSVFVDLAFMKEAYPDLWRVLYEERDADMFAHIQACQGDVIFVVSPSLHVEGITDRLVADEAMLLM